MVMPAGYGNATGVGGWWCFRNESGLGVCNRSHELCDDNAEKLNEDCARNAHGPCLDPYGRCHHENAAYCNAQNLCFNTLNWCWTFERKNGRDTSACFAQ